jgi:hypothetical protein
MSLSREPHQSCYWFGMSPNVLRDSVSQIHYEVRLTRNTDTFFCSTFNDKDFYPMLYALLVLRSPARWYAGGCALLYEDGGVLVGRTSVEPPGERVEPFKGWVGATGSRGQAKMTKTRTLGPLNP